MIGKKWLDLLSALILPGIALLIYWPSFSVPFHFDDLESIVKNPYLRISDFSPDSILSAAFQDWKHNRPLTNLSLALNFYFHQLHPFGYHLVNFLFFVFTAFGIRLALGKLFLKLGYARPRAKLASWLAALVWLAHPLNTQAVTYIVQRHSSMAGAFAVWSIYFYQLGKDRSKKGFWFFCLSGLFGLLAMLSKETALTLPLMIFLFDLYFYQDLPKPLVRRNWKWISALALFYFLAAILLFRPGMASKLAADFGPQAISFGQRIFLEPEVLICYALLMIFPFPQFLSLEHYFTFSRSGLDLAIGLVSWLILLSVILLALIRARKWRIFSFAVIWYFGQLAVEAMPLPIDLANEHRLYLALLSLLAPAAAIPILRLRKNRLAVVWILTVLAFFCVFTLSRNLVWKSRESLWKDAVQKAPGLPRAWNNYCAALSEAGKCESAIRVCQKALSLSPGLADAHNSLGICYFQAGKFESAEQEFFKAGELGDEKYGIPFFNLGLLSGKRGDFETAIKWYLRALEKNPLDPGAHYNLALAYRRLNREDDYLKELGEAVRARPEWMEARLKLAQALAEKGECPKALELIRSAPAPDPSFKQILNACPP